MSLNKSSTASSVDTFLLDTYLDTCSTPVYLSSFSTSSYRNLNSFLPARWIDRDFFWTVNSFSTAGGSIKLLFSFLLICPSIVSSVDAFLLDTWLDTYLDTYSTPVYLSSFSTSSYRNLDSFLPARWIDRDFFWTVNSFSTAGGSIKLFFTFLLICPSTVSSVDAFLLDTWLDTFIC